MIGELKLIVSWLGGKETIECKINCFSINQFYKTVDNKVIEFPLHLTDLTFNISDLTHLITFFKLILLHTVSRTGMYGLLYILTYSP